MLGLGLFGPGWRLNRALGPTAGALGALLGSIAILFILVLVLDALDILLTRLNLAAGLAAISGGLWIISQCRHPPRAFTNATTTPTPASPGRKHFQAYDASLVAPLVAIAGITSNAITDSLLPLKTA